MMDKDLLTFLEDYVTDERKQKFKDVLAERTRHFTVVLENIFQPHNASAVVRSCDIFGVQDVHTVEDNYIRKVSRRVAKGSQKWITFHRYKEGTNNIKTCVKDLKEKGYQIVGTTPHTDSCMLADFDVTKKTAFVFGEEKDGISDYVKENADGFLKIPMVGFTESLNISVAAAITLQDVTNRLKKSNIEWQLTKDEQTELYSEWVESTIKNVDKLKQYYEAEVKS
ncbi:rRNA methyltransferase [Tenacibaculum holothuriorum]|uniref:tRNA (guanosine(18)-2'-O)-methyltransferase n=1 Tax=Tenacibaculum holothuriorum TaxID=1635173 RepID=A0A1Y2PIB0_9FLAO|nr:RNA methyltransferase [Tenacibaculum holothuriorum]OSY89428.1 rRNA methyltransferase [Tenacibaculum holothuriorum]